MGMFVILVFGFMFLIHNLYGSFVYTVSKFPDDFLYVMTSAFDGVDYSDLETFHPRVSIVVKKKIATITTAAQQKLIFYIYLFYFCSTT